MPKTTDRSPSGAQNSDLTKLTIILAVVIIVLAVGIIYVSTNPNSTHLSPLGKLGPIGDYIAGVANPLLTFFVLAVTMQILTTQKTEMAKTTAGLKEQNLTLKLQLEEQKIESRLKRWESLRDWYFLSRAQIIDNNAAPSVFAFAIESMAKSPNSQLEVAYRESFEKISGLLDMTNLLVNCVVAGDRISDDSISFNPSLLAYLSPYERVFITFVAVYGVKGRGQRASLRAVYEYGLYRTLDTSNYLNSVIEIIPNFNAIRSSLEFQLMATKLKDAFEYMLVNEVSVANTSGD